MEKIIERLESIIDKQVEAFEKSPLTTSLKLLCYYWVFKKLYSAVKGK